MSPSEGSGEQVQLLQKETDQPVQDSTTPGVNMGASFLSKLQSCAHVLSHVLALLSIFLVIWWIQLLGGLSWKAGEAKQVFNWHPLLMVTAFGFMTVASQSFRYYSWLSRSVRKLTHAISWSVALLSALSALIAVFASHNDAKSGYIANLYSFHSWIGILVSLFYVLQYSVGLYAFYVNSPSWKAALVVIHKYVGLYLYQGVAVAMLLGIQEKEGFVGCSYKVDAIDSVPLKHFLDIPLACRVSHALGLALVLMTLSTTLSLHTFGTQRHQDQHAL
jgi:cytochrome b-561